MKNRLDAFWSSDRSLSVLLWALALSIFVLIPTLALMVAPAWERAALAVLFTGLVLSGVFAAWSDPATRRMVLIAGLMPLVLLWIELVYHAPFVSLLTGGLRLGAVALFAAVLFGRVVAPGPVTKARLKGALAVYLMIGLMFEEAYRALSIAWPGALSVHASNPLSAKFTAELVYFSFSTLTTAGYGDIVPLHPLAGSLANVESITGQMYIVLLIGRLLTLHLTQLDDPAQKKH